MSLPACRERLGEYMQLLVDSFNPAAAEGLMCRDTLSVGWDGRCALGCCPSQSRLPACLPACLPA